MMSKEENIAALVRFGNAVNSGNLADLRSVISADSLDNDPSPDQGRGPEGYIRMFTEIRQAFPDFNVEVVKLLADDDSVAFAYTMTGTHKGNFMGISGTDRKIKARGLQISRFENGKMVERWGSSDQLGILQQIGAKAQGAS
jgi:steroid delta-isomerase-like uncharacterized protein